MAAQISQENCISLSVVDKVLREKNSQSLCLARTHTLIPSTDLAYACSLVFTGKQANAFVLNCFVAR